MTQRYNHIHTYIYIYKDWHCQKWDSLTSGNTTSHIIILIFSLRSTKTCALAWRGVVGVRKVALQGPPRRSTALRRWRDPLWMEVLLVMNGGFSINGDTMRYPLRWMIYNGKSSEQLEIANVGGCIWKQNRRLSCPRPRGVRGSAWASEVSGRFPLQ